MGKRSELRERLPIDTGNFPEVQQVLDDTVVRILADNPTYDEDHAWSNIKLCIMAIACAVALFAQFNPWDFPGNRNVLGVCCLFYGLCSAVLQFIFVFFDEERIYISKPYCPKSQSIPISVILHIQSSFKRYQDKYILKFEMLSEGVKKKDLESKYTEKMEHSVGRWFDFEGNFHEAKFQNDVRQHLKKYEAKVSDFCSKKTK